MAVQPLAARQDQSRGGRLQYPLSATRRAHDRIGWGLDFVISAQTDLDQRAQNRSRQTISQSFYGPTGWPFHVRGILRRRRHIPDPTNRSEFAAVTIRKPGDISLDQAHRGFFSRRDRCLQIIRCERKPRLRIKEVKFERIVGKPRIFSKSFFWAARHSRAIAYLDDDGTGCGCLLGHNAADTLARHGGALKECNT